MLKILVTGCNGQLGSELQLVSAKYANMDIIFTDIDELDITNFAEVEQYIAKQQFDVLINCAGYTAVDSAEDEPDMAMKVNAEAAQHLAAACLKYHCYPVHISTDYVFCGSHSKPYTEIDIPDPASVYGKTKLLGEQYFYDIVKRGLIIRTSWMFSTHGANFVKTIVKNGRSAQELKVVFDQVGSPTYARDLAHQLLEIIPSALASGRSGIYHYSNEGVCSWYDLALEALRLTDIGCKVLPVTTSEYPTKAHRPFYSVLDKSKIKRDFGITIPYWRDSLKECIQDLSVEF